MEITKEKKWQSTVRVEYIDLLLADEQFLELKKICEKGERLLPIIKEVSMLPKMDTPSFDLIQKNRMIGATLNKISEKLAEIKKALHQTATRCEIAETWLDSAYNNTKIIASKEVMITEEQSNAQKEINTPEGVIKPVNRNNSFISGSGSIDVRPFPQIMVGENGEPVKCFWGDLEYEIDPHGYDDEGNN